MQQRIRIVFIVVIGLGCRTDTDRSTGSPSSEWDSDTGATDPCDVDGDDHLAIECGGSDCDDGDPTVHPGALDLNWERGAWTSQEIFFASYSKGESTSSPAVELDELGDAQLFFVADQGLHHAANGATGWQISVTSLDGLVSAEVSPPSVIQGEEGEFRVAFAHEAKAMLATGQGDEWSVEQIDSEGEVYAVQVTEDSNGAAMLALETSPLGVLVAVQQDTDWVVETVDAEVESPPAIAAGPDGEVHLLYPAEASDGTNYLRHAQKDAEGWAVTVLPDSDYGDYVSLAMDEDGTLYASYSAMHISEGGLRVGQWSGDSWALDELTQAETDENSFSTVIGLDPEGGMRLASHCVYCTYPNNLQVWTKEEGQWERIDEGIMTQSLGSLEALDMAVDAAGLVHLTTAWFTFSGTTIRHSTERVVLPDGIDQDCDGVDGMDGDGDGMASWRTGGTDTDE